MGRKREEPQWGQREWYFTDVMERHVGKAARTLIDLRKLGTGSVSDFFKQGETSLRRSLGVIVFKITWRQRQGNELQELL